MVVNKRAVNRRNNDLLLTLGLGFLGQFLGQCVNELVLANGKRNGFPNMRTSHGYIIQHLVESDRPVSRTGTELAKRMGVSQQAASKAVRELMRLGAVTVKPSKDRRAKQISLSQRGWDAVLNARKYRSRLEARLRERLGARRYSAAQRVLRNCLELFGGVERIRSRTIREPE